MASETTHSISTPTSSPSPPGHDSVFSPGASPPLILAFLAIGLFAVSMIGVFGWRRIQYRRGIIPHESWPTRHSHRREELGERPKLWDMWTDRAGQTAENWDSIMPVAVMMVAEKDVTPTPSLDIPVPPHRRIRYSEPTSSAGTIHDEKVGCTKLSTSSYTMGGLQVAVAIAMPSPHSARASTFHQPNEKYDDSDDCCPEYTLGLYQCMWRRENG